MTSFLCQLHVCTSNKVSLMSFGFVTATIAIIYAFLMAHYHKRLNYNVLTIITYVSYKEAINLIPYLQFKNLDVRKVYIVIV